MLFKKCKTNNIAISVVDNEEKFEKVKLVVPNIIWNRFDIKYEGDFELLKVEYNDTERYIAYHINPNRKCYLGIYMTSIEQCVFDEILKFLKKRHKNIKYLHITQGRIKHRDLVNEMHWTLHLPSTVDEYYAQFSAKTRNTRRRKLKKLMNTFNAEFVYYSKEELTREIMERFF